MYIHELSVVIFLNGSLSFLDSKRSNECYWDEY